MINSQKVSESFLFKKCDANQCPRDEIAQISEIESVKDILFTYFCDPLSIHE